MSCNKKKTKSHQLHGLQYTWKVPLIPRQPFERDGTSKVFHKNQRSAWTFYKGKNNNMKFKPLLRLLSSIKITTLSGYLLLLNFVVPNIKGILIIVNVIYWLTKQKPYWSSQFAEILLSMYDREIDIYTLYYEPLLKCTL